MYDEIKQSLHHFSNESNDKNELTLSNRTEQIRTSSFTQLSDWTNKHRYKNQSIVLPRIFQSNQSVELRRQAESFNVQYPQGREKKSCEMKPINIKFNSPSSQFKSTQDKGSPHNKKTNRITITQYLALQDLKTPRTYQSRIGYDLGRNSILQRVIARKNRHKKQHFLQQFLTTASMGKKASNT